MLFEGRPEFLSDLAPELKVYGEYGVGASTIWVARNTDAAILAADTSVAWIETVRDALGERTADIAHVDLGDIGDWGRPASYRHRSRFGEYFDSIWSRGMSPDVVLIDGRFRVACFLTSLLQARPGTRIIMDDYCDRSAYHVVEDFVKPDAIRDRQALFTVPTRIDRTGVHSELDRFSYVMD